MKHRLLIKYPDYSWTTYSTRSIICLYDGKDRRAVSYSIIGILASLILIITNRDILWQEKELDQVRKNYRRFLMGVMVYYTTDLLSQYGLTAMTYFLPYESGEEAYNSAGSDSGHAFGAYQFDNRSELGAFLTYCYQTDSSKYGAFEPYCGMDAESLCGNAGLIDAWHNVYAAHTDDFKKMQDSFAWTADATVNPKSMANVIAVQRDRGFDLMQCDAAVRGFVYSIQNRCGWEEYLSHSLCAKAGVTNAMSDIEIINALEDTIRHFDFSSSGEFAQPYTIPERYVTGGSSVGSSGGSSGTARIAIVRSSAIGTTPSLHSKQT